MQKNGRRDETYHDVDDSRGAPLVLAAHHEPPLAVSGTGSPRPLLLHHVVVSLVTVHADGATREPRSGRAASRSKTSLRRTPSVMPAVRILAGDVTILEFSLWAASAQPGYC